MHVCTKLGVFFCHMRNFDVLGYVRWHFSCVSFEKGIFSFLVSKLHKFSEYSEYMVLASG